MTWLQFSRVGSASDVSGMFRKQLATSDGAVIVMSGVLPEGREALSELTWTVLTLSTLIKETQTLISPGSVKFSPGDRGG